LELFVREAGGWEGGRWLGGRPELVGRALCKERSLLCANELLKLLSYLNNKVDDEDDDDDK
jgi:hypothetical protein